MFFVIFESASSATHAETSGKYYITLQTLLQKQLGFISEVPYASPKDENNTVLVARFEDEEAARRWRLQPTHLSIQKKSREEIFDSYRIRVGYELGSGEDSTEGRAVVVHEYLRDADSNKADMDDDTPNLATSAGALDVAIYDNESHRVQISGWNSVEAAAKYASSVQLIEGTSVDTFRVGRDYSKTDRKEAPEGADRTQNEARPVS